MEETDVKRSFMSEGSTEFRKTEKPFGGEKHKKECYSRCIHDAWDLKGESTCSSVCGF
jgi:hypothetical protein